MALTSLRRGHTLTETFSICVSASDLELIALCAELADAVTITGRRGPEVVARMREQNWDPPVLFDRGKYAEPTSRQDAEWWFSAQEEAGADRLLTPGAWATWDGSGNPLSPALDAELAHLSLRPDATVLLALDARWLSKSQSRLIEVLAQIEAPIAIVLAHTGDPLSLSGAVHGLVHLIREIDGLTVLRTDHGGFGALVHGACHAAIGARSTLRHAVPPGKAAFAKRGDFTPRLFVPQMLDWFTALTISGWRTVGPELTCRLECCHGQGVERFLDPELRSAAMLHNVTAIASVATHILDSPREERRRFFADMCRDALEHYGTMGNYLMITEPKAQLQQWAFA